MALNEIGWNPAGTGPPAGVAADSFGALPGDVAAGLAGADVEGAKVVGTADVEVALAAAGFFELELHALIPNRATTATATIERFAAITGGGAERRWPPTGGPGP